MGRNGEKYDFCLLLASGLCWRSRRECKNKVKCPAGLKMVFEKSYFILHIFTPEYTEALHTQLEVAFGGGGVFGLFGVGTIGT